MGLCALLNEKLNIENVTQAHGCFFAAQQIFIGIVFGHNINLLNEWFSIDINAYNNKLVKYKNGIQITEQPNTQWFNLLIVEQRANDNEETLKDIVIDCLSIMMLDPNGDIATIGTNLVAYLHAFDESLPQELETEAKYRFNKWFEPPIAKVQNEPVQNVQPHQQHQLQQPNAHHHAQSSLYQRKSKDEIIKKIIKVIKKGEADGTNQQEVQNFLLNQGIAAEDIAEAYDEYNRANSQPGASFYQQLQLQQNGYYQNQNGYAQQNQCNQRAY